MSRLVVLIALIFVPGPNRLACADELPARHVADNQRAAAANRFLDDLGQGEFDAAVADFDTTMARVMPAATMKLTWQRILLAHGPLTERGSAYHEKLGRYDVVYIPCKFTNAALDLKLVFDREMKIAGLFFVPPLADRQYKPPSYVDANAFREQAVTVGSSAWALPGTLTTPQGDGPFPALVLVHGSGPNDRDESIGANKPFRDLAEGLSSQGVAVLRYDKRTLVHGAKMLAQETPLTVKQETVEDALHAVKLLSGHAEIDRSRIFVAGHSLGGYLVPRIAAHDLDELIAGYVILAGSTRPTEDLMWEQTNYILALDGEKSPADAEQLAKLKQEIERLKSDALPDAPADRPILGARPGYWLDLRGYRPAIEARSVKRPMLVLQGGRDYQVTDEDFQNWKDGLTSRPDVRFKRYPRLNHLFIPGAGPSTPAEYQLAGNVARTVVDDIRAWIMEH